MAIITPLPKRKVVEIPESPFVLPAKSATTLFEEAVVEAFAEAGIVITDIQAAIVEYRLWKSKQNGG